MAKTTTKTNENSIKSAADAETKIKTAKVAAPVVKITTSRSGIAIIPGVQTEGFKTLIIGEAPLICHKFSEKLQTEILAKHMGEASAGRSAKDPHANFTAARYRSSEGWDGVPAGGCKAAIVAGFDKKSGVSMKKAQGAIRVRAEDQATNLVRIVSPPNARAAERVNDPGAWPQMREDVVRNQNGVIDIRHRPEYWPWALKLDVDHLPSVASMRQVLQSVAMAGFLEGLGEWRPGSKKSRSGSYGTWRLATEEEVAMFEAGELFAEVTRRMKRAA